MTPFHTVVSGQRPGPKSPKMAIISIVFVLVLVVVVMAAVPLYNVWQKELSGKAKLREAEWSRQIKVEEAAAEKESAKLLKEAEVERARGVAESMNIISEELEKNDNYLQYLAIQAQIKMAESPNHTTVYIPVGANGIPLIKDISE